MSWTKFSDKAPKLGQTVLIFIPKNERFNVFVFREKRRDNKITQYWDGTWNSLPCDANDYWQEIEPITVSVIGTYPQIEKDE
jgi:hypothetical protein